MTRLSRDGRFLACGGCNDNSSILVWEVETGKEVCRFAGHSGHGPADSVGMSVAVSPDGKQIVSGGYDGSVHLWHVPTGKEVRRFPWNAKVVWGVAYSADGSRILSAGDDRMVRLWDARTGEELLCFTGHKMA